MAAIKRMHSVVSSDSLTEFCREASILSYVFTTHHTLVLSINSLSSTISGVTAARVLRHVCAICSIASQRMCANDE